MRQRLLLVRAHLGPQATRAGVLAPLPRRVLRERRAALLGLGRNGVEVLWHDEHGIEAREQLAPFALLAGVARADQQEVLALRRGHARESATVTCGERCSVPRRAARCRASTARGRGRSRRARRAGPPPCPGPR